MTKQAESPPEGARRRNKTDTAILMGDTEESPKEDAETDGTTEDA